MIQLRLNKSINVFVASLMTALLLPFTSGSALAAATISVTPDTGLTNGQTVTVSGSGFAAGSTGTVVECNNDPSQPNSTVAGNAVPVSCTNPLNTLINTSKSGTLAATSFTIKTGTTGPPASGNDSSGVNGSVDAERYPCPPTAQQIAAGDSCVITVGDASGDDVSMKISFASQSSTGSGSGSSGSGSSSSSGNGTSGSGGTSNPSGSSNSTSTPSGTGSATSTLTNTGPGDTVALFVVTVVIAMAARYGYTLRKQNK